MHPPTRNYTHTRIHVHMHTYTCTHARVHTRTHTHTYTHKYTHTHLGKCSIQNGVDLLFADGATGHLHLRHVTRHRSKLLTDNHAHTHTHAYTRTCIHTGSHMHTHTLTHAHRHTCRYTHIHACTHSHSCVQMVYEHNTREGECFGSACLKSLHWVQLFLGLSSVIVVLTLPKKY